MRRLTPVVAWEEIPLAEPGCLNRLFGKPGFVGGDCLEEANGVLGGNFRLFSYREETAGRFPRWHHNPLGGGAAPQSRHWGDLADFAYGDIKGIWEQSRFTWVFSLARAYVRTGDERFAERFWELLEDWCRHNRPIEGRTGCVARKRRSG